MQRITFRQLEYFVAVGKYGSIVRASERINVSSPSISAAITQLEAEFGLPLFVRQHAQGLSLTQGGRLMYEQALRVLGEADALLTVASGISGVVRGPLNVGCLITFAQLLLPSLRRAFAPKYPQIEMHQVELNQRELFGALRHAEIDLALTYDLELPADLQFTPMVELPPFALFGEDHPLAGRQSVTMAELVPYGMVLLDLPASSDYFLSLFEGLEDSPNIIEKTRDMAVMRSLVGNGFGYSIANVRPLSNIAPDGSKVQYVPIGGKIRAMRMGVLTAQDARKSMTVEAFVDFIADMVRRDQLRQIGGRSLVS